MEIAKPGGSEMTNASPLPEFLVQRYRNWRETGLKECAQTLVRLVDEGQKPPVMMIACSDSRVLSSEMFEAGAGDFFVHRNIAALVPPYDLNGNSHATSSAIEFAVTVLKVEHVMVMGHAHCGGVEGCFDMCEGNAPALEDESSFVGKWVENLRPGYEAMRDTVGERRHKLETLEMQAVKLSLENLMTFPFVAARVEAGDLTLHGLWNDIAAGEIRYLDPKTGQFAAV